MEKLKLAIEKARRKREGEIGTLMEDKARLPIASKPPVFRPDSEIVYKHTKVVSPNQKLMERNRIIARDRADQRVEPYRQLRTQVLRKLSENEWNTLAITSPLKNAGKTLTAINLAITLSHEVDHTVLLVDLDLSQPSINQMFGIETEHGVVDVIQGRADIKDVLFNPDIPRLVVLPGKPMYDYSSEILSSQGMKRLLEDITHRYDSRYVIFDLPPLLKNDDALKFTPYADGTLLVVEAGVNQPDEIDRSLHLLEGANLLGTILNKARG